jgi:RNA polymerase sigma-70 factor, ECF subfamily
MIPDTSLDFPGPDFPYPDLKHEDRRQEPRLHFHEPISVILQDAASATICAQLTDSSLCGFQIEHKTPTPFPLPATLTLCLVGERVLVRTVWERREDAKTRTGLLREEAYLVHHLRSGHPEALPHLMEPHAGVLRKFAFSILRNKEDTEDVLQEVVVKVLLHCRQFHPGRSFRAWLMQITRNEALKLLRGFRRDSAILIPMEDDASEPNVFSRIYSCGSSPAEVAELNELRYAILNEVAALETKYRQVFLLRHWLQLEMPELAHQLGITVDTANTRLHRARETLRLRLTSTRSRARAAGA